MTKSGVLAPAIRRMLLASATLTAVSLSGCEWIASLGVPTEIREKGLLTALEEPMPLDQPFDASFSQFQVEHESEMRALLARMAEFAEELQDPMLRETYVESLQAGGPSRARAFYALYLNQSGGIPSSDKQFALWERIDKALAEGDEPELLEDRIVALAAFVAHAEDVNAARLTAAIRDEWNPDSENWHLVFAAIFQPASNEWVEVWRTASQKNLDNAMGEAILQRLSWSGEPLVIHPFASPENLTLLTERLRKSNDPAEVDQAVGVIPTIQIDAAQRLWEAAKERPAGRARLQAAYEYWKWSHFTEVADYLKRVAAEEEGYAVLALDLLSRMGQMEGVELPTGEKLARAKAYQAVVDYVQTLDGAVEGIVLKPIASGEARFDGDDRKFAAFHYSVPSAILSPWSVGPDGVVFVEESLVLPPDESVAAEAVEASVETLPDVDAYAVQLTFDGQEVRSLRQNGGVTLLDLIAPYDPSLGGALVPGSDPAAEPRGALLLQKDERWKAFDLPLDELGLDLKERNETELVEPVTEDASEAEAAP